MFYPRTRKPEPEKKMSLKKGKKIKNKKIPYFPTQHKHTNNLNRPDLFKHTQTLIFVTGFSLV